MSTCKESYGFFPCSSSLGGSILLILGYGYLLLKGAGLLSDGSEALLEVLDPGIIGGLLLPVLGALPDSLIIVVSGVGVSREVAQEQVSVGVGTLAGSTIMLLTIAWGGSLLCGRCDLSERGTAINKKLTKPYDLWRTGVTTDGFTPKGAIIMAVSVLLYGIIQVPAFLGYKTAQAASLAGVIVCLLTLAAYCVFQVAYPELQRRQIEHARQKRWRLQAAHAFEGRAAPFGSLVSSTGARRSPGHGQKDLEDALNNGEMLIGRVKGPLSPLSSLALQRRAIRLAWSSLRPTLSWLPGPEGLPYG